MHDAPLSLQGYRRALHHADVAILTPSPLAFAYTTVDGTLSRLARTIEPVTFTPYPDDLPAAHDALARALQPYPVWCLLQDLSYPAWVAGTLVQVRGELGAIRIFMVQGWPRFRLTEFTV